MERERREQQLLVAAGRGALIRCSVIAAELVGFFWFNSYALLLDALASTFDLLATVALAVCIRLAGRPPDENHPFGHGRYEPLAGLQLGLFLILIGGFFLVQQSAEVFEPTHAPMDPRSWIIPFLGVLLLEASYQQAKKIAKERESPALMAEAWHYRIDALNSLVAMIALILAALVPAWGGQIDHLGALVIAAMMIVIGIKAAMGNLRQILDHVPNAEYFTLVQSAAGQVEGVKGTEKIRIQLYGPDAHVDIDIEVQPELSVDEAHRISQQVRVQIQKEWPAVRDVTVHIEPFYVGDH